MRRVGGWGCLGECCAERRSVGLGMSPEDRDRLAAGEAPATWQRSEPGKLPCLPRWHVAESRLTLWRLLGYCPNSEEEGWRKEREAGAWARSRERHGHATRACLRV